MVNGARIVDPKTCSSIYPNFSDPRIVAGVDLSNMTLKCQLKPIDIADYGGLLSASDINQLKQIFSSGVCDYTKSPVDIQPVDQWATWLANTGV